MYLTSKNEFYPLFTKSDSQNVYGSAFISHLQLKPDSLIQCNEIKIQCNSLLHFVSK